MSIAVINGLVEKQRLNIIVVCEPVYECVCVCTLALSTSAMEVKQSSATLPRGSRECWAQDQKAIAGRRTMARLSDVLQVKWARQ